jgi:hypothetical protein
MQVEASTMDMNVRFIFVLSVDGPRSGVSSAVEPGIDIEPQV